jgi:hypothetical protein
MAGASSTAASLKQDLHQFMHALFPALRSEGSGTPDSVISSVAGARSAPRADFSNGLSALIAQVSGGSALSDLQQGLGYGAATMSSTAAVGNIVSQSD